MSPFVVYCLDDEQIQKRVVTNSYNDRQFCHVTKTIFFSDVLQKTDKKEGYFNLCCIGWNKVQGESLRRAKDDETCIVIEIKLKR